MASLEDRKPMTLDEVEDLWERYQAGIPQSEGGDAPNNVVDMLKKKEGLTAASNKSITSLASDPSRSSTSTPASMLSSSSAQSKASSVTEPSREPSPSPKRRRVEAGSTTTREPHPLFVTWNTISKSGRRSLRGCIGTFEDHELDEGLKDYANIASVPTVLLWSVQLSHLIQCLSRPSLPSNYTTRASGPGVWRYLVDRF